MGIVVNLNSLTCTKEEKSGQKAEEATLIKLYMQQPFIIKLDSTLATLPKLEQLSLSTNQIDKISNLNGLSSLKILSLGRNNIKKIEGLEAVADTLEELWISYNQIEKLNGIECCKKLKVLYVSNNKIKAWENIACLKDMIVEDLLLQGNPLEEKCIADGNWEKEISSRFLKVKKLDGKVVFREDAVEKTE